MTAHDHSSDASGPPDGDVSGVVPGSPPDPESSDAVESAAAAVDPESGPEADQAEAGEPPADEPFEVTAEILDAVVAERDRYLDQLQRTAAEFDNFRKQSQKRLAEEVTRSQAAFVERLLPVLDAIEAAQAHGSTDIDAVAIHLFGFLEKEGLERVAPTGEVFDPNVADAVMHEPATPDADSDEPVVTEVLRTGYLWNGRVIRAAMVKVAG